MDISLLYCVLVRCDLYLKLEGATIEKSNRATLKTVTLAENSTEEKV